jgi:hypothetical protein
MRYRVNDLPARGLGAFTPFMATTPAASSQGLLRVIGAPGTDPVEAPDPAALPSLTAQNGVNSAQGSNVTPDVIFPAIYVAAADNCGPEADLGIGMWRRRFAEMPMPAIAAGRVPTNAFQPPKVAGRRALAWPRAFQRFPNRTSSSG